VSEEKKSQNQVRISDQINEVTPRITAKSEKGKIHLLIVTAPNTLEFVENAVVFVEIT
jgi:hypothetical protein